MKNIDFTGLALKFVGWLLIVTLPVRPAIVAVSVLAIADFITGVWAAIKEKKPITSHGFRRTLAKMIAYQSAILVAFVLETYLLDGLPVVKVITAMVGITEGKSFFENMFRITGIDFWSQVISKLNLEDVKSKSQDKK
jgi:phage-related holin